jgi:hypothetical protein
MLVFNASSTRLIVADGDLAANVASNARHLRAANLSPKTQRACLGRWPSSPCSCPSAECRGTSLPSPASTFEAFIEDQLARLRPASAANRYASLRPFVARLVEEGELRESPMARMRKPRIPEYAPPILIDRGSKKGSGWPNE